MKFTKAERTGTNVLTSFAGGTGSGKTFSALAYARGLAGGKRFAFADTEAGRALHYADDFDFDHGVIKPPFTPMAYLDAIQDAESSGYGVFVIDSGSHEWEGEGGLGEWHDQILEEMIDRQRKAAGKGRYEFDEYKARERSSATAWAQPKQGHNKMIQRLVQSRMHIVICFRAAEKIEFAKETKKLDGGREITKTVVRPSTKITGALGWVPICEKNFPFEMTCSFLFLQQHPGVPIPIKLQERHRAFFPLDTPITSKSGELMAAWAAGKGPSPAAVGDASSSEIDSALRAIDAATTLKDLEAAWPRRKFNEAQRKQLADFYKAKQAELKSKQA
jgi:hypothetical protein